MIVESRAGELKTDTEDFQCSDGVSTVHIPHDSAKQRLYGNGSAADVATCLCFVVLIAYFELR